MVNHNNYRNNLGYNNNLKKSRMTLSKQNASKSPNNWCVYIARARTGKFYTGITNNVQRRISIHNQFKGSKFAKDQGRFTLVYVSEPFENKSFARKREIQIKGWCREKKIKLINGVYK